MTLVRVCLAYAGFAYGEFVARIYLGVRFVTLRHNGW